MVLNGERFPIARLVKGVPHAAQKRNGLMRMSHLSFDVKHFTDLVLFLTNRSESRNDDFRPIGAITGFLVSISITDIIASYERAL